MQIDWFTVGAQWINFLILMWLLHRFLYQPIIRAMDNRQRAIAERTQQAQQKTDQAERLAQEYRDKLAELETQRGKLMLAAREEAANERENLLAQARAESQSLSARWHQEIEREKTEFQTQLSRDLGHLITVIACKAVQDLSGQTWEQALFSHFLERLRQLPEPEKNRLAASAGNVLTLASSFELDEAMRNALRNALTAKADIRFETMQNSQAGLTLSSSGYSVEWTIEDYFERMDTELENILMLNTPLQHDKAPEPNFPTNSIEKPSVPEEQGASEGYSK